MDADHRPILDEANSKFYWCGVVVVFYTLLWVGWPLLLLWGCGVGMLGAYILFRNCRTAPNILLHLKPTRNMAPPPTSVVKTQCMTCGDEHCARHPPPTTVCTATMPWDGFIVPETIDNTLSKFLSIILERFIDTWHSELTEQEVFTDELRVIFRYGVCSFIHRLAKVDIPAMVSGPLLQTLVEHFHNYIIVRKNLPPNASLEDVQREMWKNLGSNLHTGLRGKTANLRYFRTLARTALPLLLPPGTASSKVTQTLLEELLAAKVMVPAMNEVASPDFLNKILIMIFDRDSKLVPMPGPASRSVALLRKFARHRSSDKYQLTVNQILKSQKYLYPFMKFLKDIGAIRILQFLLSANEVRKKVAVLNTSKITLEESKAYLEQIRYIHSLYVDPTAQEVIQFHPLLVEQLQNILADDNLSESAKLCLILEERILDSACYHVQLALQEFCPMFCHSKYYQEALLPYLTPNSRRSLPHTDNSLNRYFEKWRSRRKKSLSTKPSDVTVESRPQSNSPTRSRASSTSSISSVSSNSTVCLEESLSGPIPYHVQVVDFKTHTGSIKPFTVYTIVAHQREKDGKTLVSTVQRRFKEFAVLDTRIHQFYKNVSAHLPPKKAFHNMDKVFVETRMSELEIYLQMLIQEPEVQNSQLLRSFLMEASDGGLFMPDSVGDKAGKIIKSVPGILKKEPKGQHLDNLLQIMENSIATPTSKPNAEKKIETQDQVSKNQVIIEQYEKAVNDDISPVKHDRIWTKPPVPTGMPITVNGIMDLLVYMAIHVYGVSKSLLSSLLMVKFLGQKSIDAIFYHLLSNRVGLICTEKHCCDLIELLQNELFFNDSPPRTAEDKAWRKALALHTILTRPPSILIQIIGKDKFEDNTRNLLEGFQNDEINKQMLFSMLDVVLWELFPELRTL